jgi:hypothetical protein
MVDNSPVYEDGAFGNMVQPPRLTHASQSLSHYVDIVDETVNGGKASMAESSHIAPTAEVTTHDVSVAVSPSASQAQAQAGF